MNAVDLTDDGSVALVTEDNLAVLVDTSNGNTLFSVAGSGAGNIFYRISGDGNVFVTDGFNLDVYKFDGTTYQRVIHFSQASNWFGGASIVSRDGSTVGSFAGEFHELALGRGLLVRCRQCPDDRFLPRVRHWRVSRHTCWRGIQRQRHSDGFRFLGNRVP